MTAASPCGFCGYRRRPAVDVDGLYLDLLGAREKLCRAQTAVPDKGHRMLIDTAVACVDRIGEAHCPDQWSRFDRTHADRPLPAIKADPLLLEHHNPMGAAEAFLLAMAVLFVVGFLAIGAYTVWRG